MAKKSAAIDKSELTDEEIAALETAAETPDLTELPALALLPLATPFITSFNQASLQDVNAFAIAEATARRALMDEAHKTALIAVNRAFAGTGAVMGVTDAANVTSRK